MWIKSQPIGDHPFRNAFKFIVALSILFSSSYAADPWAKSIWMTSLLITSTYLVRLCGRETSYNLKKDEDEIKKSRVRPIYRSADIYRSISGPSRYIVSAMGYLSPTNIGLLQLS